MKRESTSTVTWSRAVRLVRQTWIIRSWICVWAASALPRHFSATWMKCVIYRRALDEAEIQGLLQPGKQFVQPPSTQGPRGPRRQQQVVTLTLGDRQFSGTRSNPPSWWYGLRPGRCKSTPRPPAVRDLDRVVLTPLADGHELSQALSRVREAIAASRCASGPASRLRQHLRTGRCAADGDQRKAHAVRLSKARCATSPRPRWRRTM